jgi:hypothetical protein
MPIRSGGRFVVLKSLDLPSVLEAGYISNPDDARRLIDPAWRAVCGRVAQAGDFPGPAGGGGDCSMMRAPTGL